MKDEHKVWIRGVEGRGKEVLNMLEYRGGKKTGNGGNKPTCIYYIRHNGMISFASIHSETARIIMDNYRELHLSEKLKDGDVLVNVKLDRELYAIFDRYVPYSSFNAYLLVSDDYIEAYPDDEAICFRDDYRLATPSEVEHFHELLHKYGKDWDAEKKELVEGRRKKRRSPKGLRIERGGKEEGTKWKLKERTGKHKTIWQKKRLRETMSAN